MPRSDITSDSLAIGVEMMHRLQAGAGVAAVQLGLGENGFNASEVKETLHPQLQIRYVSNLRLLVADPPRLERSELLVHVPRSLLIGYRDERLERRPSQFSPSYELYRRFRRIEATFIYPPELLGTLTSDDAQTAIWAERAIQKARLVRHLLGTLHARTRTNATWDEGGGFAKARDLRDRALAAFRTLHAAYEARPSGFTPLPAYIAFDPPDGDRAHWRSHARRWLNHTASLEGWIDAARAACERPAADAVVRDRGLRGVALSRFARSERGLETSPEPALLLNLRPREMLALDGALYRLEHPLLSQWEGLEQSTQLPVDRYERIDEDTFVL